MIYSAAFAWPKSPYCWPLFMPENEQPVENKEASTKVRIMHCFDKESPLYGEYNGVTIAYRRISPYKNPRMVELSVAYCSKYDQFRKKVGSKLALERFEAGQRIVFPVTSGFSDGDERMQRILENIFWFGGSALRIARF